MTHPAVPLLPSISMRLPPGCGNCHGRRRAPDGNPQFPNGPKGRAKAGSRASIAARISDRYILTDAGLSIAPTPTASGPYLTVFPTERPEVALMPCVQRRGAAGGGRHPWKEEIWEGDLCAPSHATPINASPLEPISSDLLGAEKKPARVCRAVDFPAGLILSVDG